MKELLAQLIEFLDSAWGIVEYLIDGLLNFVDIITQLPDKLLMYIAFLPPEVYGSFMIIVSLVIAYKIVGRD